MFPEPEDVPGIPPAGCRLDSQFGALGARTEVPSGPAIGIWLRWASRFCGRCPGRALRWWSVSAFGRFEPPKMPPHRKWFDSDSVEIGISTPFSVDTLSEGFELVLGAR